MGEIAYVRMVCQATRRIGRNSSPVPEYGTVLNADIYKQNTTKADPAALSVAQLEKIQEMHGLNIARDLLRIGNHHKAL